MGSYKEEGEQPPSDRNTALEWNGQHPQLL